MCFFNYPLMQYILQNISVYRLYQNAYLISSALLYLGFDYDSTSTSMFENIMSVLSFLFYFSVATLYKYHIC